MPKMIVKPYQALIDLPPLTRTQTSRPFQVIWVHFIGAFYVRITEGKKKV